MTQTNDGREKAKERLAYHLKWHYHKTLDDVRITDTPGYWEAKKECDPKTCHAMIHTALFNDGPVKHTYSYFDAIGRDNRGRFLSPYRTWRSLYAD